MEDITGTLPSFTLMEKRILQLIADGLNNSEISEEIFIGVESVKIRRKNMVKKSGCKNMKQLLNQLSLQGLI